MFHDVLYNILRDITSQSIINMEPYQCVRFQTCELFSYGKFFVVSKCEYFIIICFGCSKGPPHPDGSFECTQYVFWLRNKNLFLVSHSYLKA